LPQVRKLAPEEVQTLEDKGKGVRKLTEERYDRAIAEFDVGDYGELTPDRDERSLTSRNRLKAAASRRGLSVTFLRTRGEAMRFKMDTGGTQAKPKRVRRERDFQDEPTPVVPSLNIPPPTKKRGGRPKKTA
jgi:hypothetical protein